MYAAVVLIMFGILCPTKHHPLPHLIVFVPTLDGSWGHGFNSAEVYLRIVLRPATINILSWLHHVVYISYAQSGIMHSVMSILLMTNASLAMNDSMRVMVYICLHV